VNDFGRLALWLRQRFCSHQKRLGNLRRINADLVECPCDRCGKLLTAPYGLALPGTWVPAPETKAAKRR
jgi:hypothetical protein